MGLSFPTLWRRCLCPQRVEALHQLKSHDVQAILPECVSEKSYWISICDTVHTSTLCKSHWHSVLSFILSSPYLGGSLLTAGAPAVKTSFSSWPDWSLHLTRSAACSECPVRTKFSQAPRGNAPPDSFVFPPNKLTFCILHWNQSWELSSDFSVQKCGPHLPFQNASLAQPVAMMPMFPGLAKAFFFSLKSLNPTLRFTPLSSGLQRSLRPCLVLPWESTNKRWGDPRPSAHQLCNPD